MSVFKIPKFKVPTSNIMRPSAVMGGRFSGSNRARLLNVRVTTKSFFDRDHVIERIGKRNAKALMRLGGFMRKTMRRSMRQSTSKTPHSVPPKAPSYTTKRIRDGVFYNYSELRGSQGDIPMVVGPVLDSVTSLVNPVGKTVPQLLNEGGHATGPSQEVILDTVRDVLISQHSRGGKIIMGRLTRAQNRKTGGAGTNNTPPGHGTPTGHSGNSPTSGQQSSRSGRKSSRKPRGPRVRNRYKVITIPAGMRKFPSRNFTGPTLQAALRSDKLKSAWSQIQG